MKIFVKEFPDATAFRRYFSISLSLFLFFVACGVKRQTLTSGAIEANSPEQAKRDLAASQQWTRSDGAITGSLTINGEPVILQHTYSRRHIFTSSESEKYSVIEILLADKQVSDEALTAMFAAKDQLVGVGKPFTEDKNLLDSTSINALLFRIPKNQNNMSSTEYAEYLLTADDLLYPVSIALTNFKEFDLKKSVVTAKAKNKIENRVRVPDEAGHPTLETELGYSYEISFQAKLANGPVSDLDDSRHPPEGSATGEINLEGKVSALKYAYARYERVFFDEPERIVHLLITNVPIPNEHLEDAFNDGFLPDELKVKGIHLKTDPDGKLKTYSVREWGGRVAISLVGDTDKLAVKEFAATGDRVKGKIMGKDEANKQSFSVTFDASL